MREVGILEAKTHLSALVEAVEKTGEAVVITRHGRPVARLTANIDAETQADLPRRLSGADLVRLTHELQERISASNPGSDNITWEELKRDMRQ